ncbi:plasmid pRiA4b ORF-3 family protein [Phormidium pseudopriestleyi FRX01]|uniref:Plasmid pRiA4b ORF-3 family protein n=1 Tax=Phormidium pseudopriestleyi FRX01 TaxID=1759528 RepID=A0ABS3FKU9_9CYAN|nr:plasmid pRiA4b ORF-3 family protein [Phormidium pseudopriestleyi]MBO0347668.1 plasmid pRiA4b ORF-3 family protein [Phormidium pseudopriestleyi FRX01]
MFIPCLKCQLEKPQSIYQLKITLRGIRPPIWRRVQVSSDYTLADLHQVIQVSMDWGDCHLHSFNIQGEEYGMPMDDDFGFGDMEMNDETRVKLSKIIPGEKFKFSYLYDFGDSWEHEILVEKVLPPDPDVKYPICIKATRACPPDDSGGPWGYQDFLEVVQNKNHPDHEEMLDWVGGSFDPEEANLDEINAQFKRGFK